MGCVFSEILKISLHVGYQTKAWIYLHNLVSFIQAWHTAHFSSNSFTLIMNETTVIFQSAPFNLINIFWHHHKHISHARRWLWHEPDPGYISVAWWQFNNCYPHRFINVLATIIYTCQQLLLFIHYSPKLNHSLISMSLHISRTTNRPHIHRMPQHNSLKWTLTS